jgi:DNA-binding response OmpR family regulator
MLITAAVDELISGPALEGGRVEVLVKPFRLNDLLTRIQTHVKARRARLETTVSNG